MKKLKPFAGMTVTYSYGQFYLMGTIEGAADLDISDQTIARGYTSSDDGKTLAILTLGATGIAEVAFFDSKLPRRIYKKKFSANLNLCEGVLCIDTVDCGYVFFPMPAGEYMVEVGLIRSKEFGGVSRDDYNISLLREQSIEQGEDPKPDNAPS